MQIHQGTHARAGDGDFIRPYPCNFPGCGKSFTEKRNLNAHRRTRHTEVILGWYMSIEQGVEALFRGGG